MHKPAPIQCFTSIGSLDTKYNAPKVAAAAAANFREFFVFLLILNPPLQILHRQDSVDYLDCSIRCDYHCHDDHCVSRVLHAVHICELVQLVVGNIFSCVCSHCLTFTWRLFSRFGDVVGFEPTTCVQPANYIRNPSEPLRYTSLYLGLTDEPLHQPLIKTALRHHYQFLRTG